MAGLRFQRSTVPKTTSRKRACATPARPRAWQQRPALETMSAALGDLPDEPLCIIVWFLLRAEGEGFGELCEASLACKQLRKALNLCVEERIKHLMRQHRFLISVPMKLASFRRLCEPKFFFIGGLCSYRVCHDFSPLTGIFRRRCSLGCKREVDSTAVFHRGLLFCFGGVAGRQCGEAYDLFTNTWTDICAFPDGLVSSTIATHDQHLYVVGGLVGRTSARSAAVFRLIDPSALADLQSETVSHWETHGHLLQGRSHCGAVSYGGRIWLAGGVLAGQAASTRTVELFDPTTCNSSPGPTMLRHRRSPKLVVINNVLFAVGGDSEDASYAVGSIERFDEARQEWVFVTFALEPRRRGQCAIEAHGSKIFLFGGQHGDSAWSSWDCYDVQRQCWASQVQQNMVLATPGFAPLHAPSEEDRRFLQRTSLQFSAARSEGIVGSAAVSNPYARG